MCDEVVYPSGLHLFEAHRFLCEHVEEVAAISAEMVEFTLRDWRNIASIKVSS